MALKNFPNENLKTIFFVAGIFLLVVILNKLCIIPINFLQMLFTGALSIYIAQSIVKGVNSKQKQKEALCELLKTIDLTNLNEQPSGNSYHFDIKETLIYMKDLSYKINTLELHLIDLKYKANFSEVKGLFLEAKAHLTDRSGTQINRNNYILDKTDFIKHKENVFKFKTLISKLMHEVYSN